MRIYGSVQIAFWENSDIQKLSDQSKLLAIYLLTGPHSNMLGCFRLPDGYITEDLKWEIQHTKNSFQRLSEIDFLTRDRNSSWVTIHDFLKWNPIQNPRQGIGIQKLFDVVPTHSMVLKPLVNSLKIYGKYLDKGFINRLQTLQPMAETLSENCVADKEQNQDQEQDNKKIFMSGKPDVDISSGTIQQQSFKSQAIEILQFLNEKTKRAYRPVDSNLKLIIARLKSGVTVMDCRQVIAKKTREWKGNEKMAEYLRPATLFNATKFEQYVGELVEPEDEGNTNESVS
jgi:uncharacterized phage protein (TIGR02220 family)